MECDLILNPLPLLKYPILTYKRQFENSIIQASLAQEQSILMFTCYIPTQKEKHFILLASSPDPAGTTLEQGILQWLSTTHSFPGPGLDT